MSAKVAFYYDTDKKNKIIFHWKPCLKPHATLMNKKVVFFVFSTTNNHQTRGSQKKTVHFYKKQH